MGEGVMARRLLLMAVCCVVPLLFLAAAVSFLGLDGKYVTWAVLLLCPLMHIFLMRGMHNGNGKGGGKKAGCH